MLDFYEISNPIWKPCVTIDGDTSKFEVNYAGDSFTFDFTIVNLDWYYISLWVNIPEDRFGIWVGTPNNASNSAVESKCGSLEYTSGM